MRVLLTLLLVLTPSMAMGGALADAIDTDEANLYFSFETREGVWGNGDNLTIDLDSGGSWSSYHDDHRSRMTEGPGRVWMRIRDGKVRDIDLEVGGRDPGLRSGTVDLGEVPATEVCEVMLSIAENSRRHDLEDAIVCVAIAEGFDDWERLLSIARNRSCPDDTREAAIFWLGQEAGSVATEGLEKIVQDDDEELEIREHAIFSLSQQGIDQAFPALRRVALESRHPQLREEAFFWLAQHDDPRVIDLLEQVLLD